MWLALLTLFLCEKKALALLEQWIKHEVIQFLEVESLSTTEDKKHSKDCLSHRKRGYSLKQCYSFQGVFNVKHKAGEVLLQEGNTSINTLPFLKHDDRDKGHVMVASHREVGVEKVDEKILEAELDLDWMAQQIQNLFKYKGSYDKMDFDPDQCLRITKAIVKLTYMSRALIQNYQEVATQKDDV